MISVLIRNEKQYNIIKNYELDCIYTDNLILALKYDLYYETPRVYTKLDNLPNKLLINDTGLLKIHHKEIVTNYSFNVANRKTIELLMKYQVKKITLSVEMTLDELAFLDCQKYPLEVILYGKIMVMLLKSHPLIKDNDYKLVNGNQKFEMRLDEDKHVKIYHFEPINLIDKVVSYQKLGIKYFRVDFLNESEEEIKNIMDRLVKNKI